MSRKADNGSTACGRRARKLNFAVYSTDAIRSVPSFEIEKQTRPRRELRARPCKCLFAVALLVAYSGSIAHAGPWLLPGDPWLKADVQILSDEGVITSPISSWPLSWGDIAQDINAERDEHALSAGARAALFRMRRRAREATETGRIRYEAEAAVAEEPLLIRGFHDAPRGDSEFGIAAEWTGDRLSVRLEGGYSDDPLDEQDFRADGSYAVAAVGNWVLGASVIDRWWGPGWSGSLILSNNARPIPALVLERNFSTPFRQRWLRWIGPWSTSVIWGQLEDSRFVPNARFFGWRVNFRPLESLEIGLLRTAQWCGSGRPCDAGTLGDLLLGRDNLGDDDIDLSNEPGNQLAGGDVRWLSPVGDAPYALYVQLIGEDEAGGFPSKLLGQFGAETWGRFEHWDMSWHLHAEFADTTCSFTDDPGEFDCAYENNVYQTGYRYRSRAIGYATDNDTRAAAVGATLLRDDGHAYSIRLRYASLNRGGAPDPRNSVTPAPTDYWDLDLAHRREVAIGEFTVGLGVQSLERGASGIDETDLRAFLRLRRVF